jgi:anaerobic magnesium-protoporphyrin IX monomethyl ester cyclase
MKILLINPPAEVGMVRSKHGNMYPYSLLFLSSYLRRHSSYRADILDLVPAKDRETMLRQWLMKNSYDVVGLTGTTENRFFVCDLVDIIKDKNPKARIVLGGHHFTYTAEETLSSNLDVDIVVRGEGEKTFLELIEHYDGKCQNMHVIRGISFREGDRIFSNPSREYISNLDDVSILDDAYQDVCDTGGIYSETFNLSNFHEEEAPAKHIHVGRGCPGRCVFCLYHKWKYRTRTVDSVVEEIKRNIDMYGYKRFHLDDPHLLKRTSFIDELCSRIEKEKLDIEWYAETRADIDPGILTTMRKAGLVSIDLGLESASPKVLKAIKKEIRTEQVTAVLRKCKNLGIRTLVFSMLSLPDEMDDDAEMTVRFLEEHRNFITTFQMARVTRIYPGTELEVMARQRLIITYDFSWYDRNYSTTDPFGNVMNVPLWMEHLSPATIKRFYYRVDRLNMSERTYRYYTRYMRLRWRYILFDWSGSSYKYKVRSVMNCWRWLVVKMMNI